MGLVFGTKNGPKIGTKNWNRGPKFGQFLDQKRPKNWNRKWPPDIGKNKNYRRPNIGIWGTSIDYYFHPQKETPAPPSLSPESVNAKLIHFFFFVCVDDDGKLALLDNGVRRCRCCGRKVRYWRAMQTSVAAVSFEKKLKPMIPCGWRSIPLASRMQTDGLSVTLSCPQKMKSFPVPKISAKTSATVPRIVMGLCVQARIVSIRF